MTLEDFNSLTKSRIIRTAIAIELRLALHLLSEVPPLFLDSLITQLLLDPEWPPSVEDNRRANAELHKTVTALRELRLIAPYVKNAQYKIDEAT